MSIRSVLRSVVMCSLLVGGLGCDSGSGGNVGVSGGGGGGAVAEQGGPDSLVGFQWHADPVTANGIEFDFGFSFTADSLTASNTCNGDVTATFTVPVRYRYTATIPTAGRTDEANGGATCMVEVRAGTFDFEIQGSKLIATVGGESITFDAEGAVAGLYGTWKAAAPGVGTLSWKMGGGKITATSSCDNGLTATVAVAANFVNLLDVTEAGSDVAEDGFGLQCDVSIAAGTMEYFFTGNDLVIRQGGQDTVFKKN